MAIPPYMNEKLADHYAQTNDPREQSQRESNEAIIELAQGGNPFQAQIYKYKIEKMPGHELHFRLDPLGKIQAYVYQKFNEQTEEAIDLKNIQVEQLGPLDQIEYETLQNILSKIQTVEVDTNQQVVLKYDASNKL